MKNVNVGVKSILHANVIIARILAHVFVKTLSI